MTESPPPVVNVTITNFEDEVVRRSMDVPVVIDFWAPWCEPCRQLAPLLEQLATEYAGRFVLAKVDIDQQQDLAMAFGVQSIPHVIAVDQGRPVDQFLGVRSEAELREFVDALLPSPARQLANKGLSLEADDPQAAETAYRESLELEPDNDEVRIRLAAVLLKQDRQDECRRIVEQLEQRGFLEPEAESIKAQLELKTGAAEAGGLEAARQAVRDHPDDLSWQIKLADALAVANKYEEALSLCLSLIERDRAGIGDEAKQTILAIFESLGPQSELVSEYRRKLATLLY